MKKTLLAAALTVGFFGVAQAETSVTLYGILDGGIGYQQIKGNIEGVDVKSTKTGMINGVQSGNRWGVKGAEDLGNGLRAVFQLESGFDLGTGAQAQKGATTDRLFGRQATVGLASDAWGQLDLGRQTNIGSKYFGAIDPFGLGFGQANMGTTFGAVNTVRYDNMVMYQTPNFSGFQFGVGYSFNTDGAQNGSIEVGDVSVGQSDANRRGITTGLRYVNGPLAAALSYDQQRIGASFNADGESSTIKSWNIGAAYDFEVVKAHLAFGQMRDGLYLAGIGVPGDFDVPAVAADGLKVNSYLVGLSAPVGNGTVMASWQMADPRGTPDDFEGDLDKTQIYSLGYTYGLSKRTNLYAIGSYAKHVAFQNDLKSTLIGVGIRHQF